MHHDIEVILNKHSEELQSQYLELRMLLISSVDVAAEERLWAKLPSYYVGENFVRLIPFQSHINVEAKCIIQQKDELTDYTITPKGMLQIRSDQDIPADTLASVFKKTLCEG